MIDIPEYVDKIVVKEIERLEDEIHLKKMEIGGMMAALTELKKFHADYSDDDYEED